MFLELEQQQKQSQHELKKFLAEYSTVVESLAGVQGQLEHAEKQLKTVEEQQQLLLEASLYVNMQLQGLKQLQDDFQKLIQETQQSSSQSSSYFSQWYTSAAAYVPIVVSSTLSSIWASFWDTHKKELEALKRIRGILGKKWRFYSRY